MSNTMLKALITDIEIAHTVAAKYGHLTPAIQYSLEKWFADVNVDSIYPLPEMPMDDAERSALLALVLGDMLSAIVEVTAKDCDDRESFAILGPIVDPLWREIYGLLAKTLNQTWQSIRPKDTNDLEQRISFIENMLGLDRLEIYTMSMKDTTLRSLISKFGLLPDELK